MEPVLHPQVALVLNETVQRLPKLQRAALDSFLQSAKAEFIAQGVRIPKPIMDLHLITIGQFHDLAIDDDAVDEILEGFSFS